MESVCPGRGTHGVSGLAGTLTKPSSSAPQHAGLEEHTNGLDSITPAPAAPEPLDAPKKTSPGIDPKGRSLKTK
jgi:hypothetical protein